MDASIFSPVIEEKNSYSTGLIKYCESMSLLSGSASPGVPSTGSPPDGSSGLGILNDCMSYLITNILSLSER